MHRFYDDAGMPETRNDKRDFVAYDNVKIFLQARIAGMQDQIDAIRREEAARFLRLAARCFDLGQPVIELGGGACVECWQCAGYACAATRNYELGT